MFRRIGGPKASDARRVVSRTLGLLLPECLLAASLIFFVFLAFALAQQISEQELRFDTEPYRPVASLRVHGNVVSVDVIVRDSKGEAVSGLQQGDFKVYDKGKEQNITQFTVERAPASVVAGQSSSTSPTAANTPSPNGAPTTPRYIALFFDDRNTPFSDLAYARQAAEKFVREHLHEGDKAGVFTASSTTTLDFTDDIQKLLQTIESVHLQTMSLPSGNCPGVPRQYPMGPFAAYLIEDENDTEARGLYLCGGNTPSSEAETETVARSILSATEAISKSSLGSLDLLIGHLAQMPGHRIVVLTSSGFFTASLQPQIDEVTSDALDASVVINSLDAKGLVANAPGGAAKDSSLYSRGGVPVSEYEKLLLKRQREEMDGVMANLARDTGGIFFHNNNDLDLGFREMAAVPNASYRLGFSPANLKPDGRFHDLKVKVTTSGSFEIQARHGYFAPTEAAQQAEAKVDKLNDEVLKADSIDRIPVELGAQPGRLAAGETGLQISWRVDLRALSFQKSQGRRLDKLTVVSALFNRDGKFVTGEMGVVDMALKNKTLEDLSARGLNATMTLQAPAGNYRLRVVMEDTGNGKMFAATRPATIP